MEWVYSRVSHKKILQYLVEYIGYSKTVYFITLLVCTGNKNNQVEDRNINKNEDNVLSSDEDINIQIMNTHQTILEAFDNILMTGEVHIHRDKDYHFLICVQTYVPVKNR